MPYQTEINTYSQIHFCCANNSYISKATNLTAFTEALISSVDFF